VVVLVGATLEESLIEHVVQQVCAAAGADTPACWLPCPASCCLALTLPLLSLEKRRLHRGMPRQAGWVRSNPGRGAALEGTSQDMLRHSYYTHRAPRINNLPPRPP
jgi:hypothetical protein